MTSSIRLDRFHWIRRWGVKLGIIAVISIPIMWCADKLATTSQPDIYERIFPFLLWWAISSIYEQATRGSRYE